MTESPTCCAGIPSSVLSVSVPTKDLPSASSALYITSAAAVGLSASACMASVVLTPGWTAPACGAGVLRALGHLQILSFTRHMSASMPKVRTQLISPHRRANAGAHVPPGRAWPSCVYCWQLCRLAVPQTYDLVSDLASWSRLNWMPSVATSFVSSLSSGLNNIAATYSPPPPPVVRDTSRALPCLIPTV